MSSIKTLVSLQTFIFDKKSNSISLQNQEEFTFDIVFISSPQASSIFSFLGEVYFRPISLKLFSKQKFLVCYGLMISINVMYNYCWKQCEWQDLSQCQAYLASGRKINIILSVNFLLPVFPPFF